MAVISIASASIGLFVPLGAWVAFGIGGVLVAAVLALSVRRPAARLVFLAVAAAVLTLTVLESVFVLRAALAPASHHLGNYSSREYWNRDDPVLGYAPRAGAVGSSAKVIGGKEVYRVTYSIDEHARRRTAATDRGDPAQDCVVFFGDSLMFGEGLDDADTLPWIVQEQAGPRWRSTNFAFHGYGPHQMLAAIESGRVQQSTETCRGRIVVITQFSEQHVGRALGRASWDADGPWYVPDGEGRVVRAGQLDQRPGAGTSWLDGRFRPELLKWLDWQRLFWVSDDDREFFVALVATARDRFVAFAPAAEWHLVLFDTEPNASVVQELDRRGIHVHPIRSVVPEWRPGHPDYSIPLDGHPNRRYNEVIGRWIQTHIVEGLR